MWLCNIGRMLENKVLKSIKRKKKPNQAIHIEFDNG